MVVVAVATLPVKVPGTPEGASARTTPAGCVVLRRFTFSDGWPLKSRSITRTLIVPGTV